MQRLDKQGVGHEQIARMWGLTHPDGSGNVFLVQKELEEPGSVINEQYVHPDDAADTRAADEARQRYRALAETAKQKKQADKEEDEAPCPESSRDLWTLKPRMSLQQASKMLKQPVNKIAAEWAKWDAEAGIVDKQPQGDTATTTKSYDDPLDANDIYEAYSQWTDEELKSHAKDLGVEIRGQLKRETLIDRIVAAEQQGANEVPAGQE